MPDPLFQTPVLLLIFNRPDHARKLFEIIRGIKPRYLYIAADGPRENVPGESEQCAQSRQILEQIDWACDVKTLFRQHNLGSGRAVSRAITWFFEHEEAGIILEDDCRPSQSFFTFCQTLLLKYQHHEQIMHITGANLNDNIKFGNGSYYHSEYANVWGWATWRRAWANFDFELADVDTYYQLIKQKFRYKSEQVFWQSRIMLVKANLVDAWDYQWMLSIWKANGLCLNSNNNLVTNVGFGNASTHTSGQSPYITPETKDLKEVVHPSQIKIYNKGEALFVKTLHGVKRKSTVNYYFHLYFTQRVINLLHKIKLQLARYRSNER